MSVTLRAKHRTALAAFNNAERYLEDGKALVERGSYGHAFALLALGEEEIGKAFFRLLEVADFSMPKLVLSRHIPKQLVAVAILNLFDFLLPYLRLGFEQVDLKDDRARIRQAEQLKQKLSNLAERKIEMIGRRRMRDRGFIREKRRHLDRPEKLQSRKMDGMYVDLRGDGTISSPLDFGGEEARDYLRLLGNNRDAFLQTFGTVMKPASEEHLQRVRAKLKPVVEALGPELRNAKSFFMESTRQGH